MSDDESGAAPESHGIASHLPAWRTATTQEGRLSVSIAIALAIVLQITLTRKVSIRPVWLLPGLEAGLALALIIVNPRRINRQSTLIRSLSLTLIGVISLANAWSAGRLILRLLHGTMSESAIPLLTTGGNIWLTNVILFALWYWEMDRGGPVARSLGLNPYPDFQFVQMDLTNLAPPDWEPTFLDYFYLSFTNATAFSPTDTMPLSRWAKMTMLVQSGVSLATVALVIARAVNILK